MSPPLLSVSDLVVRFGIAEGTVYAVNGVSFELAAGETVGLVGESGCGKSVTSLAVIGLLPKPAGKIEGGRIDFAGQDLTRLRDADLRRLRGEEIGMIFQDPMTSLNPVLTIGEQMTETIRAHEAVSRDEATSASVEILSDVGIASPVTRMRNYPHELSGGMRQRVMIAMALALEPRLLIADEPTTALDVTIQAQVLDLLRRLTTERQTALMLITHDLGVVAGMTRRLLVMYAGEIVESGSTADVFAHPRHPYTVGLLHSVPRRTPGMKRALVPIDGRPPDLLEAPQGCPFAPRCRWRLTKCWNVQPPLVETNETGQTVASAQPAHRVACHNQPTAAEAAAGRPLRRDFGPAPAPAGRDDALGATGEAGGLLPDEFELAPADRASEIVIDASQGPLGTGAVAGIGLPLEPESGDTIDRVGEGERPEDVV